MAGHSEYVRVRPLRRPWEDGGAGAHRIQARQRTGCAPAWKLFETVHVDRKQADDPAPARSYADYTVTVDEAGLPAGVTVTRMG